MVILFLFAALMEQPTDAAALRDTAPMYLTTITAAAHLRAARVAGAVYAVDPDLLLSIAWHESRFSAAVVTPEAGGKFSCGAMTPEPTRDRAACAYATSSLMASYLVGAKHLRGWIDASHGNIHVAILGYGGGYRLIGACSRGEAVAGCALWSIFMTRAARIRSRRLKLRAGVS
jgi:soluble lytic murein transglycosylase-like protein